MIILRSRQKGYAVIRSNTVFNFVYVRPYVCYLTGYILSEASAANFSYRHLSWSTEFPTRSHVNPAKTQISPRTLPTFMVLTIAVTAKAFLNTKIRYFRYSFEH